MPALWPAAMSRGLRAWSITWATVAVWPLGRTFTCVPGCTEPVATLPQNTRRPWLMSDEAENFSTHCTGKENASCVSSAVQSSCSSNCSSEGPW